MYQNFIIPYLSEVQDVSGDKPASHQEPKTAMHNFLFGKKTLLIHKEKSNNM